MKRGQIFRAKEQMKWAGLILLVFPLTLHFVLNTLTNDRSIYWINFIIGVFLTLSFYSYVSARIWEKILDRRVKFLMGKTINYQIMCISLLINEDYNKANFIYTKCLSQYDNTTIISYFIKGSITIGLKDTKTLSFVKQTLQEIE